MGSQLALPQCLQHHACAILFSPQGQTQQDWNICLGLLRLDAMRAAGTNEPILFQSLQKAQPSLHLYFKSCLDRSLPMHKRVEDACNAVDLSRKVVPYIAKYKDQLVALLAGLLDAVVDMYLSDLPALVKTNIQKLFVLLCETKICHCLATPVVVRLVELANTKHLLHATSLVAPEMQPFLDQVLEIAEDKGLKVRIEGCCFACGH